jgi:hypothetical protein
MLLCFECLVHTIYKFLIVRHLTRNDAKDYVYLCHAARCTAPSTHTTTWNTCCHNTALLITMYLYWLFLKKCNCSQAQCKLAQDGPSGPKRVGANIRCFNVNFEHFICSIKVHLLVLKRHFNVIKMHVTTIQITCKKNCYSTVWEIYDCSHRNAWLIKFMQVYHQKEFIPHSSTSHCPLQLPFEGKPTRHTAVQNTTFFPW